MYHRIGSHPMGHRSGVRLNMRSLAAERPTLHPVEDLISACGWGIEPRAVGSSNESSERRAYVGEPNRVNEAQ